MPLESEYRPIILPTEGQPSLNEWQQCGALIANHLRRGSSLMLDMDGVVLKPDSLDRPELTTPEIIPSVKKLENLGFKVGTATVRSIQTIDYLRGEHGLRMDGPLILEDGHVLIREGKTEYLAAPNHPRFIAQVRQELMLLPEFQTSWNNVRTLSNVFDMFAFCPGGFQWQGKNRSSFWFFANEDWINDKMILIGELDPILRDLAQRNHLDFGKDLAVSIDRMSVGNLGILSIKGKVDGQPITKGTAARRLTQPWVFAGDGFGDTELGIITKDLNGAVIGIGGNLDVSNEPPEFLNSADFVLRNPEELTLALSYAANCLEK